MSSPYCHYTSGPQPLTTIDMIRRMVGDVDTSVNGSDMAENSFLLADNDIQAFLDYSSQDVYLTASRLCLALAASNLIQSRAIKLGQFQSSHEAEEYWMTLSQRYQDISNMSALPVDSAVAWTETEMPKLLIYKALRGDSN